MTKADRRRLAVVYALGEGCSTIATILVKLHQLDDPEIAPIGTTTITNVLKRLVEDGHATKTLIRGSPGNAKQFALCLDHNEEDDAIELMLEALEIYGVES